MGLNFNYRWASPNSLDQFYSYLYACKIDGIPVQINDSVAGRMQIATPVDEERGVGSHEVELNASTCRRERVSTSWKRLHLSASKRLVVLE
jgi:hypothetical protein